MCSALPCTWTFLLLFCYGVHAKEYDVDPIATVAQGQLRGKFAESRNSRDYLEFLGIPYAVAEIWKPASAPPKWEGIRDATTYGERCLQYDTVAQKVVGSIQCLYLNIYRPMEMEKVLPVLVHFSSSFSFGSGEDFNPKYFMDEDVILVTFNYRLNALGFLNLGNLNPGDDSYTPNLGMRDQTLALRWIRDSIAAFGGDPNRVTIFGDSAGAASVSYHILSPMSRGLFSAAISSSGNALCPWAFVANPETVAKRLSFSIGCPTKNPRYLVACLMNKDPKEIVAAQHDLSGWDDDPVVPFAPSIEESQKGLGEVFLPDHPLVMWESGNFNKVPYITGVNSQEGATLYSSIVLNSTELTEEFNQNWNRIAPYALSYTEVSPESNFASSTDIRRYYFGNQPVGLETRDNLTNMFSDRLFYQCNKNGAILHSRFSPVFLYYWTQAGEKSWLDNFNIPKEFGYHGVAHGDEQQFLSPLYNFPEITSDARFSLFSQRVVKLYASFAENGRPTATWGDVVEWNPMQLSEVSGLSPLKYLQLEENPKIVIEPFTERLDFWDSLPVNYTNIHIQPNQK